MAKRRNIGIIEALDLEDERDVLLKAADYKCRLRRSDIEEALEPADLIEDMEYIYNKLCGKYDDVNIKYWRYTEDGIKVFKSDGSIVKIEDDDFDKFYKKEITESWKKGDRVVLSTGETGTVYKDFDWQNEDRVAVQIDGMDKIKYPLSDTLTALRESNELEKRAKHHRKHQKGMSPFCSLGESLEVYNGANIPDFDYTQINLDDNREIGLHCGTEQACRDKGYKYINKLNISNENILPLDTDMAGYWSDPTMLKYLTNVFSNSEISALRKKMRAFSGEETGTKCKNYSKIIRDALLDKGYNVISYPNSVEDAGSTSYIILDSSIISKLTNISEQIDNSNYSLTLDIVTFTDSVLDTFNSLEFEQARIQVSKKFPNLIVNRSGEHVVLKGTYDDLLAFLHQYGFENWESRIELLKESKKKKKKPYSSINTNAGNVEYNNAMFNHMNNATESPSTNPTGPMGESVDNFDWDQFDDIGDDYYDDWEESNLYGGDMTYCPICNTKLVHDCDGDSMCPQCNEYSWTLADRRRKADKANINEDNASKLNAVSNQLKQVANNVQQQANNLVKNLGSNTQMPRLNEELSDDVKDFIMQEAEYGNLDIVDILDSLVYMKKDFNELDVRAFVDEINRGNVTKEVPMVLVDPQPTYRYGEKVADNLKDSFCMTVYELIEYLQTTFDGDAKLMIKYNGEYCPIQGSNFIEASIKKKLVD